MKRSVLLLLCVASITTASVALRVRHEQHRPRIKLAETEPSQAEPYVAPPPRDYVAHPVVVPEEADRGPRRIISIAPSITEIICALGMADRLVGRTPYCRYPPVVQSVPTIGALADPNLEKIKSLAPEMIFVTANSVRLQAQLRRLGLPCVAVPHDTFEQVFDAIRKVGQYCQRPRTADRLVSAIQADIARLRETARHQHPPRTLVVLGPLPIPPRPVFVAGPGSFLDTLLRLAGGRNAAAGLLHVSHGELSLEQLCALDPEIILEFRDQPTPRQRIELYRSWSELRNLTAIRRQRVRTVGSLEWLSAGPRIAIELHLFLHALAHHNPEIHPP